MRTAFRPNLRFNPSLSFVLLCLFVALLWLAGGASKPEALGQVVVRLAAITALIVVILFGERPALGRYQPVAYILGAAVLLVLLQLVPLPPAIWQALPGRTLFVQAATVSGQSQPWRPLAIVPGATVNAAISLVVPVTMLLLLAGLKETERLWLPGIVLGLIVASMLVGLLQFSGNSLYNPLINNSVGQVSSTFANRNHFALFLAFGCVLAPVWALREGRDSGWRAPIALGFTVLFVLMILASGSRGGLGAGVLALCIGLMLVRRGVKRKLRRYPRWVFPAFVAGLAALVVILVVLSIASDRAVSINRLLFANAEQDMRRRAFSTVWTMIWTYFPAGSGLGGFDPIFRIHEPFALLKLTYFNHAHNDLLEIILDAGLAGLLLLGAALAWWLYASIRVWRAASNVSTTYAKLGSAILLLAILASVFDYPARTPMVMAMIVLAAGWLCEGSRSHYPSALPRRD